MSDRNAHLRLAGGVVFTAALGASLFTIIRWVGASPTVAAIPVLALVGLALFIAGEETGDDEGGTGGGDER